MCLACDGLGVRHDFDPELLVPDPSLSVWEGAIEPLGPVKEIGKWRRHLFEGRGRQPRGRPRRPPQGVDAQGALEGPRAPLAERLALRHRRPRDRPPLEEPEQELVARRDLGGGRHRAPGQVQGRPGRGRPRPARAVHAEPDLPRLRRRPAQPPRPGRPRRRQVARRARRPADRPGRAVLRRPGRSDRRRPGTRARPPSRSTRSR